MRYNAAQFEKRAKIWICILDFARLYTISKGLEVTLGTALRRWVGD